MTDIQDWIKERETIHGKATEGPWDFYTPNPKHNLTSNTIYSIDPEGVGLGLQDCEVAEGVDQRSATAIVDAHNTLPKWFRMVEAVLELHEPEETGVSDQYWKEPDYCPTCSEYWPCPTVQKLQEAIDDDE